MKKIKNILFDYKIIYAIPFIFSIAGYIHSNTLTPKNLTEIWINKNLVDAEEIEGYSNHFLATSHLQKISIFFVDTYRESFLDESDKLTLVNEFQNFWYKNNNYNLEKIFSEKTILILVFNI